MAPSDAPTIKPPSKIWYLLWGYFALISDILSIVGNLANLTGIGLVIVTLIALMVQAGFLTTGYFASGKVRKLQQIALTYEQEIAGAQNAVKQYRQAYVRALQAGRKVGVPYGPPKISPPKGGKFSRMNPLKRYVFTVVAEIFPILNILPWQLYGVYQMYKIHKAAHREALEFREESLRAQQEKEMELARTQQLSAEEGPAA